MGDWYLLLTPFAVLVAVLLFGAVGCAAILDIQDVSYEKKPDGKPDYPATIKKEPSLVAYWRLGEASSTPVPSSGGAAKDEQNAHNGDYQKLPAAPAVDKPRHSPKTAGTIVLGVKPGLLVHAPDDTCILVDGGFEQVPFSDTLNPPQFTIEAWVVPDIGSDDQGNYYCLVESSGPPGPKGLGKKQTGFGLYMGPKDVPPKTLPGPYSWQVWMGDGTKFAQVAVSPENVRFNQLTYLVLTFDGNNLQLFLYFPDTGENLDLSNLRKLQANVATFKRNDSSNLGGGNFFIGSGSNLYPAAGAPNQRLYPFKGKIQEVALYNVDLSAPNNQGLGKLGGHESAGGNT
jgi:hypothetical protein